MTLFDRTHLFKVFKNIGTRNWQISLLPGCALLVSLFKQLISLNVYSWFEPWISPVKSTLVVKIEWDLTIGEKQTILRLRIEGNRLYPLLTWAKALVIGSKRICNVLKKKETIDVITATHWQVNQGNINRNIVRAVRINPKMNITNKLHRARGKLLQFTSQRRLWELIKMMS